MTIDQEAKEIIENYLDEQHLKRIVLDTSIVAWKRAVEECDIEKWLDNFQGLCFKPVELERKIALWLLAHFTYYTLDDVRILCREMFDKYIHIKLLENSTDEMDLKETIEQILQRTLFTGLGNNSESGNNILYYFRQENQLPKLNFKIDNEKRYSDIVYIDDVTLSGSQAISYIKANNLQADNIYFATLMASETATKKIIEETAQVKMISAMVLDERERAFAEESHIFSDTKISGIKSTVKTFCEYYGKIAITGDNDMQGCPLGYGNGQYLIGFAYNTPDNTLPIFWGTATGWNPIFKRYPKIYSWKEREIDGNKYY
jgi:hypothetical protein